MAILMRVSTYYQLINAINIKLSLLEGQEVDLVLNESSDFSVVGKKVEESGCFRKVFYSPDSLEDNRAYRALSKAEKSRLSTQPKEIVHDIGLDESYTDYYIPVDDEYNKLLYYYLVKRGCRPAIHIYEEGVATYTIDIKKRMLTDGLRHSYYGSNQFLERITEFLLYEPNLFSVDTIDIPINRLPKINAADEQIREIYTGIFGEEKMPKEPVVFFMESFHADRVNTSNLDLLDRIATLFGKENIIVKMHPRDQENWLAPKGYKIFPASQIPWEIMLMTNDIGNKLFVSMSSTAALSAQIVFDKKTTSMFLDALRIIGTSPFLKQPGTKKYYENLVKELNREDVTFFRPQSDEALQECFYYLKARGRI